MVAGRFKSPQSRNLHYGFFIDRAGWEGHSAAMRPKKRERAASQAGSWRLVLISVAVTVLVVPFAAAFGSPTAIGYVQLPGVLLFLALACCCVTCFLFCPLRPLIPKLIILLVSTFTLFWACYSVAYYWLHLMYHA